MTPLLKRLRLTAILFPAVFLPAVWIAVFSGGEVILGTGELLSYAALLAFAVSYCITLFVTALRADRSSPP